MKILLTAINAKYIHANPAVYSLAAVTGRYRQSVYIREFTINQQVDEIFSALYEEKADVVIFSCYIWNIAIVCELCELMKAVAPGTELWLGGPEVSYDAGTVLRAHPELRGIMCGEGEESFKKLAACYCDGNISLMDINGIVFRQEGNYYTNPSAASADMNTLPFIYNDLSKFENKIVYYESSRGCPFSCSYCLSSIDKGVRFKNTELVRQELLKLLQAGVPQVKFVDRTFNCRHAHTMEIWTFIKAHDNGVTNFHFEITADLLGEEELKLLSSMRPGLVQLEIGVQSTNPKTLSEIERVMDFQKLAGIVRRIQRAGNIHQHLDLIAGLPFEDLKSFKKSFNDVYSLKPQQLQLGFLKVLKGSAMMERRAEYGLIYKSRPPYEVLATKWLSFDDILFLKGVEAVLEIYYNSRQFDKSIAYLEHFFDTPFDLYAALSKDKAILDTAGKSSSRLARYEQLLHFAEGYAADIALFKELLVYDLYARENLKTRPDWAKDAGAYKEEAARFYSSDAYRSAYMPEYRHMAYRKLRSISHLEPFDYDIEAAAATGRTIEKKHWILFNYQKRSPLSYEAETVQIEGEINGIE